MHRGAFFLWIVALAGCATESQGAADATASDAFADTAERADGEPEATAPSDATDADSSAPVVEHLLEPIGYDQKEIANPERGQYLWLGKSAMPADMPVVDSYMRWTWRDFDTSKGVYAF